MSKLHEVLAVEGDLEKQAKLIMDEGQNTFNKKASLFMGSFKKWTMFDDSRQNEAPPDEEQKLDYTVQQKLDYMAEYISKWMNATLTKDLTNTIAKADIILPNGKTIAKDMPATFLLGLETKLKRLRDVYQNIPTLAPGVDWEKDPSKGEGIYKTKAPKIRHKTERSFRHKVLYEATDKHPAQIEKWEETVNVGKAEEIVWSGMLSPAEKHEKLGKIDTLIQAVKQARMRANSVEVVTGSIGKELFEYIDGD